MRAILCSDQVEGRDALRQAVLNTGLECGAEDCVPLKKILPRLVLGNADVVLVDVAGNPKDAMEAIRAASLKTAAPVLAIGPSGDANVVLQAHRHGARQFLDQSKPRDELIAAVERLHPPEKTSYRGGKIIAVSGAMPASGVTTVASGLAFALAEKYPKQVALVELGGEIPELALNLDLQPLHTLAQVMRDWERIDGSTLRQAMFDHPAGAHVLVDSPEHPYGEPIEPAACKQIVALCKAMYDFTVIDLGHGAVTPAAQQVIAAAQEIVVVIRLDVPSLRLTKIFLSRLEALGVSEDTITLVANRYGQRRQLP